MKKITMLFILLLGLFLQAITFAWGAVGHQLVAAIAYSHLTPEVRKHLDQISEAFYPMGTPLARFEYMSVEPDLLRAQGNTTYANDHFIDYPYSLDGSPTQPPIAQNLLQGIPLAEKNIQDPHLNAHDRGQWVSYLTHFVGDSHQPLHCVTMFSKTFPKGDMGANLYPIHYHRITNLHALWDAGIDGFRLKNHPGRLDQADISILAAELQKQFPETYFSGLADNLDPKVWTLESYSDAKKVAYNTPMGEKPSKTYLKTASALARERVALAGYRLAHLLNQLL